jgi:chromosome segregation ATPase
MATNPKSVEERLAALEEQVVTREPTKQELDEAQQAVEAANEEVRQRAENAEKERKKALEEQQAKDKEEQQRIEDEIRTEVDQRNEKNGANEEAVEPEPEPLPDPPSFVNTEENEHNDSTRKKYDSDVVEVTAVVDRTGKPLEIDRLGEVGPSPEIERVTDAEPVAE